jgi:hypothetical protein
MVRAGCHAVSPSWTISFTNGSLRVHSISTAALDTYPQLTDKASLLDRTAILPTGLSPSRSTLRAFYNKPCCPSGVARDPSNLDRIVFD